MKKFLSTAVALGMVAGLAATASALELKVKGTYKADGYYINLGDGIFGGTAPWDDASYNAVFGENVELGNDAWYQHTFRIDPTLIVNDRIQIKSDIRLVDSNRVWGKQAGGDLDRFNGNGVRVNKLWMVYDSGDYGKLEIGRRPGGAWQYAFVNSGTAADRIMYWLPKMDNFKGYAFLQKTEERDAYDNNSTDSDNDYYEVAGGWSGEGVNAWLGIGTAQDSGAANIDMWRVKGYADFKINDTFTVLGEFDYKTGDKGPEAASLDINSSAAIIAGVGNFGDLTATLGYAYISGDNTADDEDTAYDKKNGMGADFEPLYILTGSRANILNGDAGASKVGTLVRTAGAHAVVALADFKTSEDLTLHGGLGWGKADEAIDGWDDDYGFELDLGLAYKVYQNLTYEIHFGWWMVGDFAKAGGAAETEDIYLLSHHLSMKF